MEEKKLVPKLRFPGFTEPWEQRKLGEVANIKTGSRNQQDSVTNGQYPFFIRSEKIEKLDTYDFDTEAILVPGDGRIGEIFHYYNGKFALHQRVYKIDDFKGIDAFYLLYLFQYRFKEHALRLNAQGTVPSLRLPMFTEWDLCIPSLQEQGCIGRFLNKIELIITLHQRKLEHLKLKKKSLLQKLFPKEGEVYPELRFPGFTDPWEQRKLGDIATITGGGTPSTNISEYWNGDIDWYSPVEIGEKRYASGSIRKITKLGLEKSSAKILPVGTVLFTSRAGIGNTAILQVEGCTNQGFQSITPNSKELDTYFLYTMTPKLKRYGEVTGAGSTFVEVSGKQMEQMNLMIPSLDEQKHVSQLFKVMDDAITLHQEESFLHKYML